MNKLTRMYLLFNLFFISCNDYQGQIGASNNIEESKKRHVYINEYRCNLNPYIINDSLRINVERAWVEKHWAYGHHASETIHRGGYQLIIKTVNTNLNNYNITWTIGLYGNHYIRGCGRDCLMSDFENLPDSIESWKVQRGNYLDSSSEKEIIGQFEIYKKL